jgi:cardiolipin synthase
VSFFCHVTNRIAIYGHWKKLTIDSARSVWSNSSKSQPPPPSPTPNASQQPTESKPKLDPAQKNPVTAALLHEDIYNLPNFLTFTRLLAAPVIGYFILHDANVWAVGLLAYAGVTDLLDGWIARRWDRKTVVGTVIDPMADKTLMTVLTVCLAVKGALPGNFFFPSLRSFYICV